MGVARAVGSSAPLAASLADLRARFGVYYSAPRSEQQAPPVADVQAHLGE